MPALDSRVTALERASPAREPLLILRRIVTPGYLDVYPMGTLPAPPHLPAVDRLPGEGWEGLIERLSAMVAKLSPGAVVQVICCDST